MKVYSKFKDYIGATDLAKMVSLSSFNRGVQYLLCLIDVFTKYTWIKPYRIKKLKQFLIVLLKY